MLFAIFILTGCSSWSDERSSDDFELMRKTSSGVLNLDSISLSRCDSIIRHTSDSLEYCDYALLKSRHILLTDSPQQVLPIISKVENIVASYPSTQRTNGVLSICHSITAAYLRTTRTLPDSIIALNTVAYNLIMQSDIIEKAPDVAANLGDSYITISDMPQASKWYRRALLLADSLNLPKESHVSLYMGLGQIYTLMQDYTSARRFYEYADSYFDSMKPNIKSYFLNNYGNYFYYSGDYQASLNTYKRLESMLTECGLQNHGDMYLCKLNMSDVYLNLNQTDSATLYVDEAEAYFRENNVDVAVYYANTIKIGIALKTKNYSAIPSILASEKAILITEQNIKNIRNKYMVDYYATIGDYKSAYKNIVLNNRQNDSLAHNLTDMRTSDIMTRFMEDTLKLHHQIAIEEKNVVVSRQETALVVLLLIVVLIVFLLLYALLNIRRNRLQNNMDMFMLRLANTRQRISPHFICNVLNSKMKIASKEEEDILVEMAKLIRQNLELSAKNFVTLREELDFVHRYVELQRTLIGSDFEFKTVLPSEEECEKVLIPTMFIQILVENAVKHGIRCNEGHKVLEIKIVKTETEVNIEIIDNGPGLNVCQIDNHTQKTGLSIISQTIAIINLNKKSENRISFNIANITDEENRTRGCKASLTIPLNRETYKSPLIHNTNN